jgi:hypothetical protein
MGRTEAEGGHSMKQSHAYSPDFHEPGSPAARGQCTCHPPSDPDAETCTREAVVSFEDGEGRWQAGCSAALEQRVERGEIEPLGQGA